MKHRPCEAFPPAVVAQGGTVGRAASACCCSSGMV